MSDVIGVLVLAACGIGGLLLIPFGLPGLWVMVLGFLLFGWLTQFRSESVATIAIVLSLAFAGELIESWLGFRFARRYGGSRRAGWGALVGGVVGAVVGDRLHLVRYDASHLGLVERHGASSFRGG